MDETPPSPSPVSPSGPDAVRTGLDPRSIARAFQDNLYYLMARFPAVATPNDRYMALAYTVRDRLLRRWVRTAETYFQRRSRSVIYLSAEFLMGPQLGLNLLNLGILEETREAMAILGLDLDELLEHEQEPGLGNGGLGRLAACFLDSLATRETPSIGYGIRYEFGIFDQQIRDGWQVERADKWLRSGNPWEIERPEIRFDVQFGGHTERYQEDGVERVRWVPARVVQGMAYDTPVCGYRNNTVNLLRLWKAEATEVFDFQAFNLGDYLGAVLDKLESENLTKVLYPNDDSPQGKRLRLQQQYLFTSCALQDVIRIYFQRSDRLDRLHERFAVQLNDTHPALAVPELMRLLVDVHRLPWETAWEVTRQTFGYTNHTLMPEALERWSVPLFAELLPRHLEIVYAINHRFLEQVRQRFPFDDARVRRLSLIDESGERSVRMAHLACVGSHAINGVARLHTDLLERTVLRDFHALTPEKFNSKTNGVSPRRFLLLSNPELASLISGAIGDGWPRDLEALRGLESFAGDAGFVEAWRAVKRQRRALLARHVAAQLGVALDPDTLFDVQAKRIHEYKRQHLNLLRVVTLYNRIRHGLAGDAPPRTVILAGKAAPGYFLAKLIIRLAHGLAEVINADPAVAGRLKVVFVPQLNVKIAQKIYPAADLSEQISTAGTEASGTGNMKLALNGALTIGTLDGANVEIRQHVGEDNFFLFGLTAPEVADLRAGGYRPRAYYESDPELREALDQIRDGVFSPRERDLFRPLVDNLLDHDYFLVLADYRAYVDCQSRVEAAYRDADRWARMSILNVARMGYFSSDRAIAEYCREIWRVDPVPITLDGPFAPPAAPDRSAP